MRFRTDGEPLDIQLTDDEVADMRSLGVPKILRPVLNGDAIGINARTRAYRKMTSLLRLQAEANKAEIDAITTHQQLEELGGEMTDIAEMRRQLAAARQERDAAITAEQTARRQLEVKTAEPAIAIHAKGTSR